MGQLGFFDLARRYEELDAKNDPLVPIATLVPWESFRPKLKAALIKGELRKQDAERRSSKVRARVEHVFGRAGTRRRRWRSRVLEGARLIADALRSRGEKNQSESKSVTSAAF